MTRSPRILVVDDDRSHLVLLQDNLVSEGYEVIPASNAREAMEALAPTLAHTHVQPPIPESIDLVLLDLLMPETDGTEVLKHIRETQPPDALPVIIATGKDAPEDVVSSLRAGANDHIYKPMNVPILLARIETQLSLRRKIRSLRNAQQSLIHAARMESVGHLAAGVAHEILEPCTQIKSGLEVLLASVAIAEDPQLSEALQGTLGSLTKANQVIRKLTRFSSEDLLDIQPRDARQAVEQAVELLHNELAEADIYVETDFDPALPAALFAIEELRQIIMIVLLNAIEAMPDLGCIKVRTGVQIAEECTLAGAADPKTGICRGNQVVCIEVLDNGVGLADSDLLAPFNAFYTTKTAPGSVGLGLTIAKKLIDLQGGLIRIANREKEPGVRVTISLRPVELKTVPPQ